MPDKNVQLPDGRVVAFPDSMSDADIAAVIKKQLAPQAEERPFEHGMPGTGFFTQKPDIKKDLPMLGAMGATALAGPEAGVALRMLLGGAGAGLGSLGKQAAEGNAAPSLGETVTDVGLQGVAPELGGAALSKIGSALSPIASRSLARILRLSPKAFQFGREPAQEVLERGLSSGNLKTMAESIGNASKQVTSQLNDALKNTNGTIDVFGPATDVSKSLPNPAIANRFEQVILDAADKLGLKNLDRLTPVEANALKQEVAKSSRFVEGDMRPQVANAGKMFGGRLKDELISLNPNVKSLLESSANLTEASKGADYAVRAEKAGQTGPSIAELGTTGKVGIHPTRLLTDRPRASQVLFNFANALKDHTTMSNALRIALTLIYPNAEQGEI